MKEDLTMFRALPSTMTALTSELVVSLDLCMLKFGLLAS